MGVLIAFAVMIFLVYKKVPMALSAIIAAILMTLLSALPMLDTMKNTFMEGAASFIKSWFLLFVICAIYASAMDVSGAAYSIGKWVSGKLGSRFAIWGVSLAAFVLTYGGISCFVIVFAMFPIALVLFKDADISYKLIPAAIGAGAFLSPNTLIGSPAICNIIPGDIFGTDAMAAPVISVVVSIAMFVTANIYLILRVKQMKKKGIGFGGTESIMKRITESENRESMNPLIAVIPLIVIIIFLNVLKLDVLYAMVAGVVAAFALFWKRIDNKMAVLASGTQTGISSVMNVAPVVGLGNVAKITTFFEKVINFATSLNGSPLLSFGLTGGIITFMVSSGSGAEGIVGTTIAETYLAMGINPEVLHRLLSIVVLGFGNTPWNGTMCLTMSACECSHKDAYLDLFLTTFIPTIIGMVICIIMGTLMY